MNKFEFTNNLISFNKHNSFNKIPKLIKDLKKGKSIALVSDAGMPSICDPGEDLVKEAKSMGLEYYLYSRSLCRNNCTCFKWFTIFQIYI